MAETFQLPGLRCLGKLADIRPVIIIDTREQTPAPAQAAHSP